MGVAYWVQVIEQGSDQAKAIARTHDGQTIGEIEGVLDAPIKVFYANNLRCKPMLNVRMPFAIMHALCAWGMAKGMVGVMIHTDGRNFNRMAYKELGFVPVHGCPGLLSAVAADVLQHCNKILCRNGGTLNG